MVSSCEQLYFFRRSFTAIAYYTWQWVEMIYKKAFCQISYCHCQCLFIYFAWGASFIYAIHNINIWAGTELQLKKKWETTIYSKHYVCLFLLKVVMKSVRNSWTLNTAQPTLISNSLWYNLPLDSYNSVKKHENRNPPSERISTPLHFSIKRMYDSRSWNMSSNTHVHV